jgi:sugar-specific transcriptional regulator TrmB
METTVIEQTLQDLGLTNNEMKIYLFLLKQGQTTTGLIISETEISNSRVYESLNNLINKGLVTYNIQKNGKHFSAVSPNKLLDLQKEREEKLKQIIPNLEEIRNTKGSKTTTAVYEGYQGFKTAFQKIIDDCPNGETIHILGFSEQQEKSESLRLFISNMNLRSASKKQKLKIILDASVKKTFGKDRKTEKFSEVKYMPEGYISPAAIDIFSDYVYIFLWEEKPFVFMIKNKIIAESFKTYFEFMWKLAKK